MLACPQLAFPTLAQLKDLCLGNGDTRGGLSQMDKVDHYTMLLLTPQLTPDSALCYLSLACTISSQKNRSRCDPKEAAPTKSPRVARDL